MGAAETATSAVAKKERESSIMVLWMIQNGGLEELEKWVKIALYVSRVRKRLNSR